MYGIALETVQAEFAFVVTGSHTIYCTYLKYTKYHNSFLSNTTWYINICISVLTNIVICLFSIPGMTHLWMISWRNKQTWLDIWSTITAIWVARYSSLLHSWSRPAHDTWVTMHQPENHEQKAVIFECCNNRWKYSGPCFIKPPLWETTWLTRPLVNVPNDYFPL